VLVQLVTELELGLTFGTGTVHWNLILFLKEPDVELHFRVLFRWGAGTRTKNFEKKSFFKGID
jgi:hypothetical protein